MKFKGFVSDMDGVVADTEAAWYEGARRFLAQYGAELSREIYQRFIGRPPQEEANFFRSEYGIPLSIEEITASVRRNVISAVRTEIRLNDGYLELLKSMKRNQIKISLASTSPRVLIDRILDVCGIKKYFLASVSVDETGSKASAYLRAIEMVGLTPQDCFALEDSPTGARAAKEAGLYCVVVSNPHLNGADFSFADEVHNSIPEFLQNGKILKEIR